MKRDEAYNFVEQTFTQSFDKNRFRNFIINLLNHLDETKASSWNLTYIKDAFKSHVQRYERLGTFTSPQNEKLDVLVVYLTTDSKLERARTAIRNFVADHLKNRDEKDAALVAFVSPSESTWRFSYVKMEYVTVVKDSGQVGVQEQPTPARRFSYIVGEGESCHTAQARFLGLLQQTSVDPALTDIEAAFSVETVTKEFFTQYAERFSAIHAALADLVNHDAALYDEFASKGINTVDFAKKLMGQIVFLYFLQKKGWLGVARGEDWGTGPRDFLRRLADGEYGSYDNFFNDMLEPLFYDTLATDRGHEAWSEIFQCRLPFLNGGLFEPLSDYDWLDTPINLPDDLFFNAEINREDDTGTGVLDIFDRYNFTVNEAEPLEKEVAIDPEMLGKVFENLIEENRRKGLGAYYTPREIVHYMCQETLINYLNSVLNSDNEVVPRDAIETFIRLGDQISHYEAVSANHNIRMPQSITSNARVIDEALGDITVCDPAVGSGAFPVGMMTEIVRARSSLTQYFNDYNERTPYYFKRHAIQNCLYGVDIDAGAVEIAKLRLWLSLVVDEEDVKQIKPLPNLDYKIILGNSLIGVEKNLFNVALFNHLEELKPLYFNESDRRKKDKYKREIDRLIHELTNGKQSFDLEIYFSEVFHNKSGFDVVIGNPPYNELRDLPEVEQNQYKTSQYYKHAKGGRVNLFQFFYPLALAISRHSGIICLITQNSILAEESALSNRRLILGNSQIVKLVSFPERDDTRKRVFESAKMSVCIGILRAGKPIQPDYEFEIAVWYDRFFSNGHRLTLTLSQVCDVFPDNLTFPMSTQRSFEILKKIKQRKDAFYVTSHSGEVDMTKYKKRFNVAGIGTRVLTGAQVLRYRITDDPSQGEIIFLDTNLSDFSREKSRHISKERIVMQRITGVDSRIRLIMTLIPGNILCANSTNYISLDDSEKLRFVLSVLNSKLINYYFKQTSTNTNITTTEINSIPIPKVTSAIQSELASLVNQALTAKEANAGISTINLEQEIDRIVYEIYGLAPDEIAEVEAATGTKQQLNNQVILS